MASPVGGRFKFTDGVPVHLGLKNPGKGVSSGAIPGDLNIEAFTGVTTLPSLAPGYTQGVIVSDTVTGDRAPELIGTGTNQLLTGRRLTLFGGNYKVVDTNTVPGNTARITAGSGNQTVVGAAHDTLIGGTGTQSIVGSAGHESIVGGTGTYSVVGGAHDTIKASSSSTSLTTGHIAGGAGLMAITIGKAGHYKVNSGAGDTITAVAGSAIARISGAKGDRINLTGNTGRVTMVSGAGGDTITAGTGQETVVGKGGSLTLTLGASGTDSVSGSAVVGAGDTIRSASGANLIYTLGKSSTSVSGGDLLNLSGSTGTDTIIAFRDNSGKQYGKVNDTIIAGNGHETIKGGPGDRIGVGNGSVVGGTLTFIHSSTLPGAEHFGTNDTVNSTTYDTVTTGVATRGTVVGSSLANVTVTNFKVGTDSLFYKGETSTLNNDIVITSRQFNGNTTFTLPDGTVMTLIGVSSIHASFFKA
jgi:Ca2+-binding RTX toxin-like protein